MNGGEVGHPPCEGEEARRPRGRPKTISDEERRSQIVDCARETFLEFGYAGTTTDLVASRCRLSKGTLYRLFSSKTELFGAIVVKHRKSMLNLPLQGEYVSLNEALGAIFMVDIEPDFDRERMAFINFARLESTKVHEIGDLVRRYGAEESQRLLADWLFEQRERGLLQIDDVASGSRMLLDMVFGAISWKLAGAEGCADSDSRRAHVLRCIDVFLNGVRPRHEEPSSQLR